MSKKKSAKFRVKVKSPDFTTVGVRFSGKGKIFTYLMKKKADLKRGDLAVVESPFEGPAIVFVVRVDGHPVYPADYDETTLKWIQGKVVEL